MVWNSNQKLSSDQPKIVDPSIFDRTHFEHQTFFDVNLQIEILALFHQQLNEVRSALTPDATPTSWRFVCHTLKGAASAVGANEIAGLAGTYEVQGMPSAAPDVVLQLAALHLAFARFQRATD